MKLDYNLVAKAMLSLNTRFRTYTPEALKLVAREYHEDLESEMSTELFTSAVKAVRKKVKFFPSVAEIIDEAAIQKPKTIHPSFRISDTSIDRDRTPEEMEMDSKRLSIIYKVARQEITHEEGTRQIEGLAT